MARLTYSQAQNLLHRYQASGMPQLAFCKKHNISTSLFRYWLPRCEVRNTAPKPTFQEITLTQATASPAHCTLALPGGIRLEFPVTQLTSVIVSLTTGPRVC
jgi:hypothetical protein